MLPLPSIHRTMAKMTARTTMITTTKHRQQRLPSLVQATYVACSARAWMHFIFLYYIIIFFFFWGGGQLGLIYLIRFTHTHLIVPFISLPSLLLFFLSGPVKAPKVHGLADDGITDQDWRCGAW